MTDTTSRYYILTGEDIDGLKDDLYTVDDDTGEVRHVTRDELRDEEEEILDFGEEEE